MKPFTLYSLVSHALFADDKVIFSNGGSQFLKNLINFMKDNENMLGQKINKDKTYFYVLSKMKEKRSVQIGHIIRWKKGEFSFTYLGCPLFLRGLG